MHPTRCLLHPTRCLRICHKGHIATATMHAQGVHMQEEYLRRGISSPRNVRSRNPYSSFNPRPWGCFHKHNQAHHSSPPLTSTSLTHSITHTVHAFHSCTSCMHSMQAHHSSTPVMHFIMLYPRTAAYGHQLTRNQTSQCFVREKHKTIKVAL